MAKVSLNGWAVTKRQKQIEMKKKKKWNLLNLEKWGGSAPIVLLYPHNRMRRLSSRRRSQRDTITQPEPSTGQKVWLKSLSRPTHAGRSAPRKQMLVRGSDIPTLCPSASSWPGRDTTSLPKQRQSSPRWSDKTRSSSHGGQWSHYFFFSVLRVRVEYIIFPPCSQYNL